LCEILKIIDSWPVGIVGDDDDDVDDCRRTVIDRSTGQKVILSYEDVALARSLVKGKYSNPNYNPYEVSFEKTAEEVFLFVNFDMTSAATGLT